MGAFVTDTFTGSDGTSLASHTGELGATWTIRGATSASTLDTNRLKPPAAESAYHSSGTPTTAEYDVAADLYVIPSATAGDAAVLGRVNPVAEDFYLAQYNSGATAWRLFKRVAGTYTQLGTYTQTLSADTTYRVLLQIRDATKKVFIDGVERISSADNEITAAGRAGLRFDGAIGVDIYIDNFSATQIETHNAIASLPCTSTLTSTATTTHKAITSPSCTSTLISIATTTHKAITSPSCTSTLISIATTTHKAITSPSCVSTVIADAEIIGSELASASLSCVATLSVSAAQSIDIAALLSCSSSVISSLQLVRFFVDLTCIYKIKASLLFDFDFTWNAGDLPYYYYKISGKCNGPCVASSVDNQQYMTIVLARSLREVCEILGRQKWSLPITLVEKYSLPLKQAEIDKLVEAGESDGVTNELLGIANICQIPECVELCLKADPVISTIFDMSVIDSIFTYLGSGGLSLGGGAVAFVKSLECTGSGGLSLGGSGVAKSSYFEYMGIDGVLIGGEAGIKSSNWHYSAAGGMVLGGSAIVKSEFYHYIGDGFLLFSGNGTSQLKLSYSGSSGLSFGGEATANITRFVFIGGG